MQTIAAIATPPGHGGIAIIRISGPASKELLSRVFLPHSHSFTNFKPWLLHHGAILDAKESILDDALAVFMPGPNSFTGEDTAEIHCHGNPVIANELLKHLFLLGAQPAQRGEFTKRAYLNGRMDLSQAEAVAEIISAPTREAVAISFDRLEGRLAQDILQLVEKIELARQFVTALLDFTEDEVEVEYAELLSLLHAILASFNKLLNFSKFSRLYQQGARVVLAGRTNAGKSSLLNALSGQDRALVTPYAGTTRDFLEQTIEINGMQITLIDTAGLNDQGVTDPVELLGIKKSFTQLKNADLILLVMDGEEWINKPDWQPDNLSRQILKEYSSIPAIIVWNKCDLFPTSEIPDFIATENQQYPTSCVTGENLDLLKKAIFTTLAGGNGINPAEYVLPNVRQTVLLEKAQAELQNLIASLTNRLPLDCCAAHLDEIFQLLGDILGLSPNEEILDKIFSTFCIGK